MHQGKTYLVNALDLSGKVVLCQEADLKYYTKMRDYTDIHVNGGDIVRIYFATLLTWLQSANPHDTRYYPERILLYDKHPGGSGISVQVQPHFRELLTAALDLLISCHCSGGTGFPNCVQVSFDRVVSSQKEKLFFQSSFVLLILNLEKCQN
ncbi:hypothetical protein GIB67_018518 [Kingdonia uniflora]|uniref:MrfA-like Zn-binding domain-containing protein n=1 Tax=Kingdonia uniflora TaxID=39325 RepID=A0A7J7LW73_9MAGN|nr:hypothetical protein GIB67_018518 [Kingdonia uniflora]